jgi:hypothetical protein
MARTIDGLASLMAGVRGLRVGPALARSGRMLERTGAVRGFDLEDVWGLGLLHEASVEARRDSGSYYTPRSVVSHIVERTVTRPLSKRLGGLGDSAAAERVLGFTVCDPAMGCGFFLVEALRAMSGLAGGGTAWRSAVARGCLFGMDLDAEAARIARLSVWLEARDPDLDPVELEPGLLAGNALSGTGFPVDGGFDAVVANPPYGARLDPGTRRHLATTYRTGAGYRNTALHFIERCHDLLAPGGRAGLIVPKSFTYSAGWASSVGLVLPGLVELVDASLAFEGVRLEQVIVVFDRRPGSSTTYATGRFERGRVRTSGRVPRSSYADAGALISSASRDQIRLFASVQERSRPMSEIADSFRGLPIQGARDPAGLVEAISGRAVTRFAIRGPLERFSPAGLPPRAGRLRTRPKIVSQNVVAHVLRPEPHLVLMSAMDTRGRLSLDTVTNTIVTDPETDPWFVLALLNSRFMSWYAHVFVFGGAVRTMHLDASYVGRLPVPLPGSAKGDQRGAAEIARELSRPGRHGSRLLEELESCVRSCFGLGPRLP